MKTRFFTRMFVLFFCLLFFTMPAYAADPIEIAPSGDQTGQTDADAMQTALSGAEPGALIQLAEGTYYLNHVLLAENFQGTIQGAGRQKTIITTVGELPVSPDVPVWKNPPSLANPWPFVLTIVDGDVTLQGMTWRVSERIPMRFKWMGDIEIPAMPAIVAIFSSPAGEAGQSLIQEVSFEGAEGELSGYNLIQALYHEGAIGWKVDGMKLLDPGYPLQGEHRVSNAYFKHAYAGNSVFNLAAETTVTIEKSTFVECVEGVEVIDSGGTIIVANNIITTTGGDGVGVIALQGYWSVPEDSAAPIFPLATVKITGNTIYVDGGHAAVDLSDMQYAILGTPPSLDATVEGNQIVLTKANYGILGYGLTGIQLRNNTINGSALYDGIHVSFATNTLGTLQPGDKAHLGAYGRDVLRRAPQLPTVTPSIEVTPTATTPTVIESANTATWPGPRNYHAMSYDSESQRVILLGGQLGSMVPLIDTWAYDPATGNWQAMSPSLAPPASEGPMAYDEKADRILYIATLDGLTFGPMDETWSYDFNSNKWEKLAPAQSLSPGMVGARMVYDSESERMILFGGYDIPNNGYSDQTWVFDFTANSWTQMEPTAAPPGTNFHSMVYDSASDRVLLWGSVSDDRIWSYDYNSNTWTEVIDSGTPPLLDYTRMVYVPELQQSILFGGVDVPKEVPQGNTWLYDHTTKQWQQLPLTHAPEARGFHSMIYEPTSKHILLFGGGSDRNRAYGDLWRFDPVAQSWTEITPVGASSAAVAPAKVGFFLTGADKRAAADQFADEGAHAAAFYELPDMDKVHVASLTYKESLALDLYYPADYDFTQPLPAVVFIHGVDMPELSHTLKDYAAYVSWGQLVAADGMVGVTYDSTKPAADTIDVLQYLHDNAAVLGIDPQRTCIWASSANPPPALEAMTKADEAYYAGLRCAVVLYGETKRTDGTFPPDFSLMAVRMGKDFEGFYAMMTDLVNWAEEQQVDVTVVDYEEGEHAFDVFMDTPRTRQIIEQVLEFLKKELGVTQ